MKGQGLLFFFFLFLSGMVFSSVCEFQWDGEKHDFHDCDVILVKNAGNGSLIFLNESVFVVKYEVQYVPKVVEVENWSVRVIPRNISVENVSVQILQKNVSVENVSVQVKNRTVESVRLTEKQKVVKEEDIQHLFWAVLGVGLLVLFGDRIKRKLNGGGVLG